MDFDIFDLQDRFVAVAPEASKTLWTASLTCSERVVSWSFRSRLGHCLFWRGIELGGLQLRHGKASVRLRRREGYRGEVPVVERTTLLRPSSVPAGEELPPTACRSLCRPRA